MTLAPDQLAALMVAISFAGGLSVYTTVAALGLLSRAGVLALPPSLHLVGSWPVIAICAVMFVREFFADKIPTFDLIWNALLAHPFLAAAIVLVFLVGIVFVIRFAIRALRRLFRGAERALAG